MIFLAFSQHSAAWGGSALGESSLQVLANRFHNGIQPSPPSLHAQGCVLVMAKARGLVRQGVRGVLQCRACCHVATHAGETGDTSQQDSLAPQFREMGTCRLEGAGRSLCNCRTFPLVNRTDFSPFPQCLVTTAPREGPCCLSPCT